MRAQRAQRLNRRARRRLGIHESGEERIALGAIYEAALGRDRPAHQRIVIS
jgi:hypothetical protein